MLLVCSIQHVTSYALYYIFDNVNVLFIAVHNLMPSCNITAGLQQQWKVGNNQIMSLDVLLRLIFLILSYLDLVKVDRSVS